MSRDFPLTAYNDTFDATGSKQWRSKIKQREYGLAWNAVAYRSKAFTDHCGSLTRSIRRLGVSPPPEQRYRQEKDLFGLFVTGQSILESLAYAAFTLAASAQPSQFPMKTERQRRRIGLDHAANCFARSRFNRDRVARLLRRLSRSRNMCAWAKTRNTLIYRQQPGRHIFAGNPSPSNTAIWGGRFNVDIPTIQHHRDWMMLQVTRLTEAIQRFTVAHIR